MGIFAIKNSHFAVTQDWLQWTMLSLLRRISDYKLSRFEPTGLTRLGAMLEKYHELQPKHKMLNVKNWFI